MSWCEMPECFTHKQPRARRPHKCCECGGRIQVGETYHRMSGVWDGEPSVYKVCPECEILRADVDKDLSGTQEATGYGGLWESVDESQDLGLVKRYAANQAARGVAVSKHILGYIEGMENAEKGVK